MFTVAGWMTLEWEDERLIWNPDDKDDIESAFAPPDKIWKPELVIDNSLEELGVISLDNLNLRYDSNGVVEWEPPKLFKVHCQVDITYYPYDQQKCAIIIVGWGYLKTEVDLAFQDKAINLDDIEAHGEWIVTKTESISSELTETQADGTTRVFPQLEFWIYIKRRTAFYNLNVIMPVVVTTFLVAFTFIVPFESGEKLSYILTVFLSLAVLLTITADSLPPTSITVSVLGMYLGIVTVLAAVGILMTIMLWMVYNTEGDVNQSKSGSEGCVLHFLKFAACCICSSKRRLINRVLRRRGKPSTAQVAPTKGNQPVTDSFDEEADMTWKEVAIVLDRFVFVVFLAVTIFMNVGCLVGLMVGADQKKL
ncbi:hypothetical protein DPMN_109446 [Dreissena polymorpha]|uniref:Uncharacterized protein n=2 Tax=Dreissena polymorpha TaxID=45954 RepID=A0A9D4KAA6_DREPO|nr:hypothetical protein DPMN_109446 [Dreissena polymorpha]